MDMDQYRKVIEGRDCLIKSNTEGSYWESTTSVCAVYEKGGPVVSSNHACHYGMKGLATGSFAVVSGLQKPNKLSMLEEDEALLFLDWLLNRSPYSEVFITKSAHEALLHKVIAATSDAPSNLLAAGLVASRRLWEYAEVARVFCDLVKAGVDEDLAFYLGHIARVAFDRTGSCDWYGNKNGHCSMDSSAFGKESMINWLSHKPVRLNQSYKTNVNYEGYARMFGDDGYLNGWIHQNFPYKRGQVKAASPFPVDSPKEDSCKWEDFIDGMVGFQHKIFEHIGWKQSAKEKAA